jgi:hypothetical protein
MSHKIDNLPGYIALGQEGETGATEISFDVSAWADLWPTGAGQVAATPGVSDGLWLTYTRQGETDVYPVDAADLSLADDVLTWTPSEAVLDVDGQGTIVIHCTETGVEKRSVLTATIVATGHAAEGTAPEPLADYIAKWGAIDVTVTEVEPGEDTAADITQDSSGTHLTLTLPTDLDKWAAVDIAAEGLAASEDPTASIAQDAEGTHFALGVPKGDQGIQGVSAYAQAVAGGYVGDEAAFNADLAGLETAVDDAELARDTASGYADDASGSADAAAASAAQLAAGVASPAGQYADLAALIAADPDHAKTYLTLDDGKWCYYNGTAFVAGGTYQATGIADGSITKEKLAVADFDLTYQLPVQITHILPAGDFSVAWATGDATVTRADNIASFTASAAGGRMYKVLASVIANHKYYLRAFIKCSTNMVSFLIQTSTYYVASVVSPDAFVMVSGITIPPTTGSLSFRMVDSRTSGWDLVQVKNIILVDLTAMYGAGNEPTVAVFDALMYALNEYAYFEPNVVQTIPATARAGENIIFNGLKFTSQVPSAIADNALFSGLDIKSAIDATNILPDGDFTSSWSATNATASYADNTASFTATAASGRIIKAVSGVVVDHEYYVRAFVKCSTNMVSMLFAGSSDYVPFVVSVDDFTMVSGITTAILTGDLQFRIQDSRTSDWDQVQVQNVILVDLTAMYGAGNEPTAAAFDALMFALNEYAYFEPDVAQTIPAVAYTDEVAVFDGLKFSGAAVSTLTALRGKTITLFGDSIAEGNEDGSFAEYLAARTGATVINLGVGGALMTFHGTTAYDAFSMTKLADSVAADDFSLQVTYQVTGEGDDNTEIVTRMAAVDWSAVDIIVINHMTNDYVNNRALGTIADSVITTFCGAMNYVVDKILTAYPAIKIVFVSAAYRARKSLGDGYDSDNYDNDISLHLADYADAMKAVAEKHHLAYKDMYRTSGINSYTQATYLRDGLHLSYPAGCLLFGDVIGAFLLNAF